MLMHTPNEKTGRRRHYHDPPDWDGRPTGLLFQVTHTGVSLTRLRLLLSPEWRSACLEKAVRRRRLNADSLTIRHKAVTGPKTNQSVPHKRHRLVIQPPSRGPIVTPVRRWPP
ncbi:hypothetical protein SSAG_00703 [Streptomyces sp. Mg1]|nr:hypothetical protein SSAG_00703 [Streptomyces sp. Mg1]